MTVPGQPPGGFGPRPFPDAWSDDAKTPVALHAKPSPVVVRSGDAPKLPPPLPHLRAGTPHGGTLATLGRRSASPPPQLIVTDPDDGPELTPARVALMKRILRTCDTLPEEDLRLMYAFALRLRPGVVGA